MKKILIVIVFALLSISGFAKENHTDGLPRHRGYGTSFGFMLNQYVDDFGLGLSVTGPYVFDVLALRATGTVQFSRQADWAPWWTVQAGLVGGSHIVAGFARFYGEGGVVLAFPENTISSASHGWGGYGHFGFEFFTGEGSPVSYFIEIGATGSGLRADLSDNAFILNGLKIQAGFRGYPWKG